MPENQIGRLTFLYILLGTMVRSGTHILLTGVAVAIIVARKLLEIRVFRLTGAVMRAALNNSITHALLTTYIGYICLNLLTISLLYGYKLCFIDFIEARAEVAAFVARLKMKYERFNQHSLYHNVNYMNFESGSIASGIETLLFDVILNIVAALVILGAFVGMLEREIVSLICLGLGTVFLAQLLLCSLILGYKRAALRNEEMLLTELHDLLQNSHLAMRSGVDDNKRLGEYYQDKSHYRYTVLSRWLELATNLFLVMLGVAVLYRSRSVRKEAVAFCLIYARLAAGVKSLLKSLFVLDSKRVEMRYCMEEMDLEEDQEALPFERSISLRGVSVFVGDTPVMRDVHLDLHAGEVVAIVGLNGAGKTMFLRFLLGFVRYRGGLTVDSFNKSSAEPALLNGLRRISSYCPAVSHEIYGRASDDYWTGEGWGVLAEQYGYPGSLPTTGSETDLGYMQLCNISYAMSLGSRILLLDEPTNYFDHQLGSQLLDKIVGNKEKRLVLVIVHRKDDIAKFNKIMHVRDQQARMYYSHADYISGTSQLE